MKSCTSPGDLRAAVSNLFDHYEQWADVALRLVSLEDSVEELRAIASRGRELHAAWPVHLLYPPSRLLAPKLRTFIDFAVPRLAAVLDGLGVPTDRSREGAR